MNTLRQALENVGFKVDKYYSSEIKSYAVELTQHHFPDTIQVGDINNWKQWNIDWKTIDFIGSGSPCQDLSAAGKRAGINGSRSSLFFVFIDILNHVKSLNPDVIFLQENVGSAPKLDVGIMSRALGLYPVRINSKLVTAQLRDRYYWTNIRTKNTLFDIVTDIPQPKDLNIKFKDIIDNGNTNDEKSLCILEGYYSKAYNPEKRQDKLIDRYKMGMQQIVFVEDDKIIVKTNTVKGKAPCLLQGNEPLYTIKGLKARLLNKQELCKLQGFDKNYCDILTRNKAGSLLGDGWTLPIIEHILKYINTNTMLNFPNINKKDVKLLVHTENNRSGKS
jgi:site-specific DNA-cytosine methylase